MLLSRCSQPVALGGARRVQRASEAHGNVFRTMSASESRRGWAKWAKVPLGRLPMRTEADNQRVEPAVWSVGRG
eukprot:6150417-Pyramimonas_sp.AAC.1